MSDLDQLIAAIRKEQIESIDSILDSNPSLVNQMTSWHDTALIYAVKTGNDSIIDLVLSYLPKNLNQKTKAGFTAALAAISSGNERTILTLLKLGAEILDDEIHRKTITEHPKVLTDQVIAVLLESGANLEMLSDGIAKSNSFRYIDLLINNGFKIARKLACVAGGSSLELFHNSQPSITDYHIALYSAIVDRNYIRAFALLPHCGRPVCFRDLNHGPILLVSGGEPRLRGNVLKMALARRPDIPKDLFNIDPFDITEDHKRLFHLLIESGANINRANHRGSTPVLVATRNNDIDYLTELLRHGANPNTITETGNSPLLQALVGRNALAYIDLLLSYGAKFDSESIRKGVFKRTKDFLETQLLPEEKLELEQAWRFIIEKSSHHGTSDNSC